MKRLALLVLAGLVSASLLAQDFVMSARKLQSALYIFNEMYVDTVNCDKLAEEAVRAMVKLLDPHTEYMTREEMKELNEPLQGGFDGIGISFNMMKDTLFIVEVITGGPSEKVGLLAGDRIIKVNGETIAGVKMSNKEVMKRLKGPKGTKVTVSVKRRGQSGLTDFRITRDKIPLYSLDASFMVDKQTGYIKISRFGATTMDEFHKAFADLQKQGMKQLVLDLQSNGGGQISLDDLKENDQQSDGE